MANASISQTLLNQRLMIHVAWSVRNSTLPWLSPSCVILQYQFRTSKPLSLSSTVVAAEVALVIDDLRVYYLVSHFLWDLLHLVH